MMDQSSSSQVYVYKCQKGVRRVKGLQVKELKAGNDVAVIPTAVSLLLSDRHLEFTIVFDWDVGDLDETERERTPTSTKWLGFCYAGGLDNLKRCFRKPPADLPSYLQLLHDNMTAKFPDPFTSPLLLVGDGYEKAFYQIPELTEPYATLGFIPLRPVNVFHSLKSHPIVYLQGEESPVFTIATTVDRNILLPYFPEADVVYSRALNKLHSEVFQSRKWSTVFIPPLKSVQPSVGRDSPEVERLEQILARKAIDEFYAHFRKYREAGAKAKDSTPTKNTESAPSQEENGDASNQGPNFTSSWKLVPLAVTRFTLCSRDSSLAKEFDLAVLSTTSSGKSYLMQAVQYFAPSSIPGLKKRSKHNLLCDIELFRKESDLLIQEFEVIQELVCNQVAVYNPWIEQAQYTAVLNIKPSQTPPVSPMPQRPLSLHVLSSSGHTTAAAATNLPSQPQAQPQELFASPRAPQYMRPASPLLLFGDKGREAGGTPYLRTYGTSVATPSSTSFAPSKPSLLLYSPSDIKGGAVSGLQQPQQQRTTLMTYVGDARSLSWSDKLISPEQLMKGKETQPPRNDEGIIARLFAGQPTPQPTPPQQPTTPLHSAPPRPTNYSIDDLAALDPSIIRSGNPQPAPPTTPLRENVNMQALASAVASVLLRNP